MDSQSSPYETSYQRGKLAPLGGLVRALARLDFTRTEAAAVDALLRAVPVGAAEVAAFVHFERGRYTRNCVYRDERFELLVLCWPDGVQSPIHDHGRSRCFVKVQSGSLAVDDYALVRGGRTPGHARSRFAFRRPARRRRRILTRVRAAAREVPYFRRRPTNVPDRREPLRLVAPKPISA